MNGQKTSEAIAFGSGTSVYQYRWNAVKEITMPGNLKRTVTLDALQRPERIEVKGYGTTPGNNGAPVMDHKYTYDEVSNIQKKTTLDGDYIYGYDRLDRLTDATPPVGLQATATNSNGLPVEKYSYDNVHNRMTSIHQPGQWVYNDNNELLAWGTDALKHAITYDLNGSTIKDQVGAPVVSKTTAYVYDAQDRMVEVRDNGVSIAKYAYDPMGRRIWRQAGAEITWFLYSDEGLIQELASANSEIRTYGWNPGGMWGTDTVWQKDTNGVFLSNNDHLYTTDVLTGAVAGVKSWGGVRESFGKTTVQAGSATTYLMRFPGQWEDGVGGFNQNWNREYKYVEARYYEQDPALYVLGKLPYAYVNAAPVSGFDPSGLADKPCCDAVLPSSPDKEVALTCYAEIQSPEKCSDSASDAAAMVSTIYNRLATKNKYFAKGWCSGPGKTAVDVVACAGQYLGYNNSKYLNAKNNSGSLNQKECEHLKVCIAAATSPSRPLYKYHNFNQTAGTGRTKICLHYYREKTDPENRNDY
jgi:RHS repeat-associated protein